MPIFRGFVAESAVESVDSIPEPADYTTDSVIVCRLPLSNMFNILSPLESAEGRRRTVGVGQQQIGLVGTGLYSLLGLYAVKGVTLKTTAVGLFVRKPVYCYSF